jgi:hypothetical protein
MLLAAIQYPAAMKKPVPGIGKTSRVIATSEACCQSEERSDEGSTLPYAIIAKAEDSSLRSE